MDFKVGDWVKSYSQGIWRIERIITDFFEIRYSMDVPKTKSNKTLCIMKRLVNDKWKRSFSMEVCSSVFINRLTIEEKETLDNFISSNKKTMKDFEKYQKNIDLILNISFSFNDDKLNFNSITNNLFEDNKGLTSDDILNIIGKSELSKYIFRLPQNKAIQFISNNHEICDSKFIFRKYRILNF